METVYQIEASRSPEARKLFEAAGVSFDRPYWEAAFDGRVASRLFVDDPYQPSSALLTRTYDFFLAGEASPVLLKLLADAPPETQVYDWFYGFVPLTTAWRDAMPAKLPELVHEDRRAFRLPVSGFDRARDWASSIPDGVRVDPLNAELARQADDEVPEVISILWDGYDAFARGGWGFAAIDSDGHILSTSYACGLTDREVNIGVGTAKHAQRRGLAKLVCQACIAYAEQFGLYVTWDCDRPNEGSGRLAESLGFVEEDGFIEYAFPDRSVPRGVEGSWFKREMSDGVVVWERTPGSISRVETPG
jgi:RimJ/RimL family protein N-acetyltransferase